jgi:glycosyltransferase involved in cell wall biosynthesis
MIEAMACGTPVIAYNKGAEVVEDGMTGFIVKTIGKEKDNLSAC